MILIAPKPGLECVVGDRLYQADHLQMIREVEIDHLDGLLNGYGCIFPPRAIVANSFPTGTFSIHCYGCGAYIEKPVDRDPWTWFASGDRIDFVFYHHEHVEWVFVRPPSATPALVEPDPISLEAAFPQPSSLERPRYAEGFSVFVAGGPRAIL